jgi:hypothetical protein
MKKGVLAGERKNSQLPCFPLTTLEEPFRFFGPSNRFPYAPQLGLDRFPRSVSGKDDSSLDTECIQGMDGRRHLAAGGSPTPPGTGSRVLLQHRLLAPVSLTFRHVGQGVKVLAPHEVPKADRHLAALPRFSSVLERSAKLHPYFVHQ